MNEAQKGIIWGEYGLISGVATYVLIDNLDLLPWLRRCIEPLDIPSLETVLAELNVAEIENLLQDMNMPINIKKAFNAFCKKLRNPALVLSEAQLSLLQTIPNYNPFRLLLVQRFTRDMQDAALGEEP